MDPVGSPKTNIDADPKRMFFADPDREPVPSAVRDFMELPGLCDTVPGRAYFI